MKRAFLALVLGMLWAVPAWSQNVITRVLAPLPETNTGTVRLAWDRSATDAVPGVVMKVYVDTQPGVPFAVTCNEAVCAAVDALALAPGRHVLQITATDPVAGEGPPSNHVETLTLEPCTRVHPTTGAMETWPIGSPLPGGNVAITKAGQPNYASDRIAQLRKWGWRVEWQKDSVTTLFVVGDCAGRPQ